jgi:hypothetical protein
MARLAQREWTHDQERTELTEGNTHWTDPGPWHKEPDKVQWIDEATNYACLAVRGRLGVWCGYVGVPEQHPFYKVDCDDLPVSAHGGLTYSDLCQEEAPEGHGICHIPEPGHPDNVWWLGFDCAHAFDLAPGMIRLDGLPSTGAGIFQEEYRTLAYVQRECESLAAQLREHG